jgi:hypothetical protein
MSTQKDTITELNSDSSSARQSRFDCTTFFAFGCTRRTLPNASTRVNAIVNVCHQSWVEMNSNHDFDVNIVDI